MTFIFKAYYVSRLCNIAPSPDRPIYICRGKDCRKKKKAFRALTEKLSDHGEVIEVRCQKICKGPVAGLELDGQLEWFAKLNDEGSQGALVRLLEAGELKKRLKALVVKKRRAKLRGELPIAAK